MEDVIEKARLLAEKYILELKVIEKQKIRIDGNDLNGFSFSLSVEGTEYLLDFGSWHQEFGEQEEALFVFEKCLSGKAQVRDVTSLNIPYKGILEIYDGSAEKSKTQYVMVSITSFFLFPFPKREKVYRNSFAKAS